jgi:endonuclease V-like protein UPF0215 family
MLIKTTIANGTKVRIELLGCDEAKIKKRDQKKSSRAGAMFCGTSVEDVD